MLKRFLAVTLAALMIFAVGCDNTVVYDDLSDYESSPEILDVPETFVNPLTGVADLDDSAKTQQRPVAIMINNLNASVQNVQTGLSAADIIYETEVEGGLTRLLAVYQDISGLDKIGTVRSARYQYIDLAMGHDAVYIHCGYNVYCEKHLKDLDEIDLNGKSEGSKRISNGLASEHTVYALAGDLWNRIDREFDVESNKQKSWVNFAAEDESITLDGGAATSVSVPFPAQTTKFTYDEASKKYNRIVGGAVQTDYYTKEVTQVKNVFVLLTDMSYYADGKTRKVSFNGGDGYYITNGTVQFIKWSKGDAKNGIKFTDTSGNEIKVSAGNSWVCIANKTSCNPTIQ